MKQEGKGGSEDQNQDMILYMTETILQTLHIMWTNHCAIALLLFRYKYLRNCSFIWYRASSTMHMLIFS